MHLLGFTRFLVGFGGNSSWGETAAAFSTQAAGNSNVVPGSTSTSIAVPAHRAEHEANLIGALCYRALQAPWRPRSA